MQPYGGAGAPQGPPQGGWGGQPGHGYGAAGARPPAGGPKKKSPILWIVVGCLGLTVLVVIVLAALAIIGLVAWEEDGKPTAVTATAHTAAPPAPAPAPNTKRFVNRREGLKEDFAANFVPFSFDYPQDWRLEPDPGNNFVRVSLRKEWEGEPGVTKWKDLEVFSAGYFNVPLAQLKLEGFLPQGAKKVDERPVTVGAIQGKELRAEVKTSDGGTLWLRAMALPSTAAKNVGLFCFLLAHEESPNVTTLDDVGKKGGLATILESLKIGAAAAKAGASGAGRCASAKDMGECLQCCLGAGSKGAEYRTGEGCTCAE